MNQDVELKDQKVEPTAQEASRVDLDFVSAISDRQLGFAKRNCFSSTQINTTAEDELVKKQFKEKHCELPGVPRSTFLMEFSPDGTKVASTHGNHQIYVTDVRTGKHIKTLVGHPRTPWCIAFHPTSNQIIASGCLGGQVRIWDLSGGSEVWTSATPSVIASIAFHPDDRLLVIATYNELFFWDWSKPEPFMRVATASVKEKVRYVAFDTLGHKLITGITNSPQTRWERVRTVPVSVSVPVPPENRPPGPCPRRMLRRVVAPRFNWPTSNNNNNNGSTNNNNINCAEPSVSIASNTNTEPLSSIPDHDRRITSCYRELVHQYEVLVHRYLQVYRRPIMIDQGTDPMEIENNTQSTSSGPTNACNRPDSPIPSTSGIQRPGRKSSAAHPPKNRNRRRLFHTDSGGSSSSSSSSEDDNRKAFGSTQTGESRPPDTANNTGTTANKSNDYSSSSSDDDGDDDETPVVKSTRTVDAAEKSVTDNNTDPISSSGEPPYAPARQLKLSRRTPPATPPEASQNEAASTGESERKYKMRIKCFVTPRDADAASSSAGSSSNNRPTANDTNTTTISINLHNFNWYKKATMMLTRYHNSLQQQGLEVSHINIPQPPSLPPSSTATTEAGTSCKPSKGTNTNENEAPPKRKRRLLRPNLLGNILFTSSDESSSDEGSPAPNTTQANPPVSGAGECSGAGQSRTSAPEVDARPNRKRRLEPIVETTADATAASTSGGITESDADAPPKVAKRHLHTPNELNAVAHEPIADEGGAGGANNNQSESLMDRQTQRLVVESLSVLDGPSTSEAATLPNNTSATAIAGGSSDDRRLCGSCGRQVGDSESRSGSGDGCARTATVCTRVQSTRSSSSTTVPPTTPPLDRACRRFLSHRLSAFHPTRLLRRMLMDRSGSGSFSPSRGREPGVMPMTFAQDEVINYSERDGEEVPSPSSSTARNYALEPPSEIMSINPENIGIGSMYSNIVQELESSLNDVRNIRFRLGEMSEMLGNFSDRLENIMTQSNTILRNLSTSLEDLPATDAEPPGPPQQPQQPTPRPTQSPAAADTSSYSLSLEDFMQTSQSWIRTYRNPYAPSNPVNSDHTYPINPDATQNATLSPLHLSLQLTVTHIQRQARLLRQQVESIERIDRAMIEVAQLQMMRQMFDELHVHFGANSSTDNRSGVSSVRQMMAGTRISDSSPYDSPSDEGPGGSNADANNAPLSDAGTGTETSTEHIESQPSTSSFSSAPSSTAAEDETTHAPATPAPGAPSTTQANRARSRKNYPRCLFLMHRQYRRSGNSLFSGRRNSAKDRLLHRRNIYRRFLPSRTTNRATIDLSSLRGRGSLNLFNPDSLPSMTRRVEHYLMEHCRYIGRTVIPPTSGSGARSDMGEHVMTLRLNNCRMRMNHLMGQFQLENYSASVTADGTSRFAARQALSYTLDTITRFVEATPNTNISSSFRSQIWEVIELSLLLSELLVLQIVDSIPPPSGMNLDSERETLSMRIDRMCTRMIHSRLTAHSNQLTRSLRLMRLTVRHATRALRRTYTQRRNAMLPTSSDNDRGDSRQGLLDDIHNCLRNIRRYRELTSDRQDDDSNFGDWYRTINDLISRYTSTGSSDNPGPSTSSHRQAHEDRDRDGGSTSVLSSAAGGEIPPPMVTIEDANSSDDSTGNNDVVLTMRPTSIGLYQFSRSQDDDNDEDRITVRSPNFLSVPMANERSIPEAAYPWRTRNRLRLSDRLDDLRTMGIVRSRFLHPLYSGVVNPFAFDDNLDEAHREPIYDSDVIPTVTPNHRIQVWEFSQMKIPNISNSQKNLVVNECKIHNDASVDYASDGSILVTLLPSGGYMNVTNRLGVYSLEWENLGQCLYVTSFEQNAVSVSLSPTNRHLLVGLASRRVSILPTETWTMARIFLLDGRRTTLASIRELEQNRDSNFMSLNCIRWLPTAGQGLIFGTNTGHLRLLT